MPQKKIIYITPVIVPSNSAASKRILANAQLIKRMNYEVEIYSGENYNNSNYIKHGVSIKPSGININKTRGFLKLIAYIKSINYIIGKLDLSDSENIKAIIIYSGYTPYILPLKKWCKRKSVKLIFDAVEWYTPSNRWHYIINPYYWNTEIAMRYLIPKLKRVISISEFLHQYFIRKKSISVVIPPLFYNIENLEFHEKRNCKVISYTGFPGKKDEMNYILKALLEFNKLNTKIIFEIAGINEDEISQYSSLKNIEFPSWIIAHGLISMKQAQAITKRSDYSILLRSLSKSNQAGFPTKVVESLSLGTPIISNYSSDLKKYLIDEKNSFICDELNIDGLISIFTKIMTLKNDQYLKMRQYTFQSALDNFYFDKYMEQMKEILE